MSEGTHFKPGDKVRGKYSKREFRVEFGPYSTESMYAVTSNEGLGYGIRVVDLEPIPPADPRVDVVAAALARENDGYRDPVPAHEIELWASSARAVLAALDAHSEQQKVTVQHVIYPQPRRVRDNEGDVWELRGRDYWCDYASSGPMNYGQLNGRYGPLTPLED